MIAFTRNPYLVLATVALFWGGNAIAGKLAVGHVSPMMLTLLRWGFACAFMAPFAIPVAKREWPTIRQNLPLLFGLGAVGFTCFNALFYLSLNYTTAINVTIEQSAMPLVVLLANFVLFRTGVAVFQVIGFSLTLVGVALTASHGSPVALLALDLNRGDALMMVAVFIYGLYTVALKFKPALDWRSTIFVLSLAALVVAIPFALIEQALGETRLPDLRGLTAALYTAVFPSLLGQALYIRGVEMIGPNRANLFINLVPVFGAILAVAILGETLHGYHIAALAFVIGGILLAERGVKRQKPVQ